jgi:preprotein translocase subunit Sec63
VNREEARADIHGYEGRDRDALRRLALRHHPDRNHDARANERFMEVTEVYAVLSDDEKRPRAMLWDPRSSTIPWRSSATT